MLPLSQNATPHPSGWPFVGNERAVEMLRRSLRSGRMGHAYLFTGPAGVGKRTLALNFAMAVNCPGEPPPGQLWPDMPCGLCSSCNKTAHGLHPDVVEINLQTQSLSAGEDVGKGKNTPSKEIKIDVIREMQATTGLSPHSGRWKVYVIDDADRMNEEASNCLLKTLEEPAPNTLIILLAPDQASVLPTISSRCLHVPLRPLSRTLVASSLVDMWGADEEQAGTLAALSGGRLGTAVKMLNDREALTRRRAALEEMSLLSGAPVSERINIAARLAKLFTDARTDLYAMLDLWEGWWRDVLVVKASASELAANADQLPTLSSVANRTTAGRAAEAVKLIQATRQQLLENVNPRLALESLTLNLP